MQDYIRKLLEAAIRAPSGENAQPWKFVVRERESSVRISVFVAEDRDGSPYGWGSRASFVAVGAAIENIRIAATALKREARVVLFPDPSDRLLVADVEIIQNESIAVDPLYAAIEKRSTNRKKYKTTPLTEEALLTLRSSLRPSSAVDLRTTTDKRAIRTLAVAGSTNERIMLNNKGLHDYFFGHVNWTKEEDNEKKVGFFIDTLELPPPAVAGFKLMSKWSRASFLNKVFGFNKLVSAQNASLYASVPLMGIITAKKDSPEAAVTAGMALQRVWLQATLQGLSLQPIAGLLYLMLSVTAGEAEGFSNSEQKIISAAYANIRDTFGFNDEVPYFMFRVGYAEPPSARAVRFSIDAVTSTL